MTSTDTLANATREAIQSAKFGTLDDGTSISPQSPEIPFAYSTEWQRIFNAIAATEHSSGNIASTIAEELAPYGSNLRWLLSGIATAAWEKGLNDGIAIAKRAIAKGNAG